MFIDEYAFQCGFCTPGVLMVTQALLDKNPHPTRAEIEDAPVGQLLQVHQSVPCD
ncbi:MAG: 2Fe-2S iron-sulfur cluster-binding protein [Anaerovoracaceae bacterium]